MNCSWCHKPFAHGDAICGEGEKGYHRECANELSAIARAKCQLDALEQAESARDPDCDPMASDEAQRLLAEYRRLNRLALAKLHPGNRFRLMFDQPLLD